MTAADDITTLARTCKALDPCSAPAAAARKADKVRWFVGPISLMHPHGGHGLTPSRLNDRTLFYAEQKRNMLSGGRVAKPTLRMTPACSHACIKCDVICAELAGLRDDLWGEVQSLRLQHSTRRDPGTARSLEAAQELWAAAWREHELARHRSISQKPEAEPRTYPPARLRLAWQRPTADAAYVVQGVEEAFPIRDYQFRR